MRKIFFSVFAALLACVLFAGCGSSGNPFPTYASERNFIKEEYEEEYNRYEDELNVSKRSSEIRVSAKAVSGIINLKIIEKAKDGSAALTFEYEISDTLNETIKLEKKHWVNWIAICDINEQTEGGYKIEVFE